MTESSRPLTPGEVARLLESAAAAIHAEIAALGDDVLAWHPARGEWCVKEVIGHLIESERRGFAGRIRLILSSDEPSLEAWDQGAIARARRDCERPAAALITELAALRRDRLPWSPGSGKPTSSAAADTRRSAICGWATCCTSGSTTTGTTCASFWPTSRRPPGRTWGTPGAFRRFKPTRAGPTDD